MLALDISRLPPDSAVRRVARGSGSLPEFVLADRPLPRFVAARWRRHRTCLGEAATLDQHLLSFCERGGALSTIVVDGVRRQARQRSGTITFIPAGSSVRWRLECPFEVVHLHVYIAPLALAAAGPLAPVLLNHHDPWFEAFFRLLLAEHEACCCGGRLDDFDLLERLSTPMARRLAHLQPAGAAAPPAGPQVVPLRQWLLGQVEGYVEQHLGEPIRLADLARLASLSVDHFARAFVQATGSTPHRWLLDRRLAEARQRLRSSTAPVSAIARACGFAGPAHFASVFRRQFGVTPTAYRHGAVPTS